MFLQEEPEHDTACIQSFIVKIELHPLPGEPDARPWHAQIAHVPSGRSRYVRRWDEVIFFILDFLQHSGVRLDLGWRIRHWLYRRQRRQ